MKIIILAAGKGTRLLPLTRNTPKPLLDLGHGKTLLEEQLERIQKSGVIDEVILVIGYLAEQIEAKIKMYQKEGLKISTVYNPFHEMSNNLITLWMAKHHMDDDFMIVNGDNVLEHDVFKELVENAAQGISLTISKKQHYDDDDMKVLMEDGKAVKVSKSIENDKAHSESVGLVLVSGKKHRNIFKESMEKLVRNEERIDNFWLEIFNSLSANGVPVDTFEIDGETKWREMDFHPDVKKIRNILGIGDLNKSKTS